MKKFQKVCLILFLVLSVAGACCMIAGFAMGASYRSLTQYVPMGNFKYEKNSESYKTVYEVPKSDVENIKIKVGSGNLAIVRTDGDKIILKSRKKQSRFRCDVNNKTLQMSQRSTGVFWSFVWNMGAEGVLEIPRDVSLKKFRVDLGSGDLDMETLKADETNIECGSGNVQGEELDSQDITIKLGSGDLDLALTGSKIQYQSSVQCGSGDVSIDSQDYDDENHDTLINENGSRELSITCGSGDINIDFTD